MALLNISPGPDNEKLLALEPNFEEQYNKTQKLLLFLVKAISKKDALVTIAASIQECQSELERLVTIHESAQIDFKETSKKYIALGKTHETRQKRWESLDVKPLAALEAQTKLAEENAALIQERLHLKRLKKDMWEAHYKVNRLKDGLEDKKEENRRLKKQRVDAITACRNAVRQWNADYQLSKRWTRSSETSSSDLTTSSNETDLQLENVRKESQTLKDQVRARDQTIASLKLQISKTEPIYDAGLSILRRREQNMYPRWSRNEEYVEAGKKAAHYGSPLADAVRVHVVDKTEVARNWYEEQYGVTAELIMQKIGKYWAPLFLEVLYWHKCY
ncbi:hypothetical protein N431DRAFT_460090 [Stipitochalara longipes BDJ]|nr:hypothetical protein N431DRAFT_460090 [Stipitochalara longipes BDJ]